MKLRTRLDVFSAALLSALGIAELTACGGTAESDVFSEGKGGTQTGSGGNTASGGTSSKGGSTASGGTSSGGSGNHAGTGTGGTGGHVAVTCVEDSDCGNGLRCLTYDAGSGCGPYQRACQSAADECAADTDCQPSGRCWLDPTKQHFACSQMSCFEGRPFLVEACERLAEPTSRTDWRELDMNVELGAVSDALSARLAEEWTRIALMEHASIAAFARFGLQLLSLGAPPELVERATAAMADETRHAKACFALASTYARRAIGPGPLSIEGSLEESTFEQIVITTIREGCIGETLAAIQAREACEHATDPRVRKLLQQISEDESRHAELAWRFVRWALEQGDALLAEKVRAEFSAQLMHASPKPVKLSAFDRELLQSGVIPEPMRPTIYVQALEQVVRPCFRALLDSLQTSTLKHERRDVPASFSGSESAGDA